MLRTIKAAFLGVSMMLVASASQATILVGQCIEFAPCYFGVVPWSDSLNLANLTSLGLGSNVDFVAGQTSQFIIRLGVTTITFTTGTGSVTETLPEFSGSIHNDPCNLCEIDIVGTFFIPANALSAVISGQFGNSAAGSSAGVNLCLGDGPPCGVASRIPEPGSVALLGIALAGLGLSRRRKLLN